MFILSHRATERHVPYEISLCYPPPDRCERAPPYPQPSRPALDLPTPEGWKAELTLVVGYIPRWFTCPQTVTRPSSNHLIATRPGVELISYHLLRRPSTVGRSTGATQYTTSTKQSNKMKFKNTTKTTVDRQYNRYNKNVTTYNMLLICSDRKYNALTVTPPRH